MTKFIRTNIKIILGVLICALVLVSCIWFLNACSVADYVRVNQVSGCIEYRESESDDWKPIITIEDFNNKVGQDVDVINASWSIGDSNPSENYGAEGEFFYNTKTTQIFYKNAEGWVEVTYVKGVSITFYVFTGCDDLSSEEVVVTKNIPINTSVEFYQISEEYKPYFIGWVLVDAKEIVTSEVVFDKDASIQAVWDMQKVNEAKQSEAVKVNKSTGFVERQEWLSGEWKQIISINDLSEKVGNSDFVDANWISGEVAPVPNCGSNGDYYYNTKTTQIFTKENNVWNQVAFVDGVTVTFNVFTNDGVISVREVVESKTIPVNTCVEFYQFPKSFNQFFVCWLITENKQVATEGMTFNKDVTIQAIWNYAIIESGDYTEYDLNGDGAVSKADADVALELLSGTISKNDIPYILLDANHDNQFTIQDVTAILNNIPKDENNG